MTYQETINYLFNSTPVFEHVGAGAYKEGLFNSLELDKHFNHPHKNYLCVHVAGTNGKGSTSHTLASILQEEGYRVGLFTSPHLVDFRERIKINGQPISKEYVVDFVKREKAFFEPLHPSFFELTTAMAFKYFADEEIDIAIIEVGLGGRLDCTNIISPILSIITNISLDHTNLLGNTLEQIAREKAGIIKEDIPVVIGESTFETKTIFVERASCVKAPISFAEEQEEIIGTKSLDDGGLLIRSRSLKDIHYQLGGDYQVKNAGTIIQAAKQLERLQVIKKPGSVNNGFKNVIANTGLMGRWQELQTAPTVVCDTGHNVSAWEYLSKQLMRQKTSKLRMVFGMVDDKDIQSVMSLLPKNAIYYFTQANNKRAIAANSVAETGYRYNLTGKAYSSVSEAYKEALNDANPTDFIFVGGSSYVVADLLVSLGFNE